MTPKELDQSYNEKKVFFHQYINSIKKNAPWDIYTIINATLIKNPFTSTFPKSFFSTNIVQKYKITLFIKNTILFYLRNIYLVLTYFIAFLLYKLYYKKQRNNELKRIIDVFGLVDKVNKENVFNETYFHEVYDIFNRFDQKYCMLIRPYQVGKNPFKLVRFFKIINNDSRDFIFEYELLTLQDLITLFGLILMYPFKTFRLLQKEKCDTDRIFNISLFNDIKDFSIEPFTRYLLGKKLASIPSITTIYSWCEFQVIERSFNYAIRVTNPKIKITGCQFYLNYETYFNTYIEDLDYTMLSSPHKVLVNGAVYLLDRQKVIYSIGVSLRYKSIFHFNGIEKEIDILLLGSYLEKETHYMLECCSVFNKIIFKNHPTADIKKFKNLLIKAVISHDSIYTLFKHTKLVIGTASGTAIEAVACGISCIIIASQDNLTANPLIQYGKGEIWDIAFSKDDVVALYNSLLAFRNENKLRIKEIAAWYKDNFFIEPTEKNIAQAFDLDKE